jgi:glutaredoxin
MKKYLPVMMIAAALMTGVAPARAQTMVASPLSPQILAQATSVTDVAEAFIDALASGDYTAALQSYAPFMRTTLTTESIAQQWEDITAVSGEYQQPISMTVDDSAEAPVVIINAQFENGVRDLFILFNEDNQIVSMDAIEG